MNKVKELLDNLDPQNATEPEELIGNALYLLQLCQQDLNFGRKETIWARAKRAKETCEELESLFKPKIKTYKTPKTAQETPENHAETPEGRNE